MHEIPQFSITYFHFIHLKFRDYRPTYRCIFHAPSAYIQRYFHYEIFNEINDTYLHEFAPISIFRCNIFRYSVPPHLSNFNKATLEIAGSG